MALRGMKDTGAAPNNIANFLINDLIWETRNVIMKEIDKHENNLNEDFAESFEKKKVTNTFGGMGLRTDDKI